MIKTIVGLFDVHLATDKVDDSYKVVKKFIKDIYPDEIVLGGDFLDCAPLSHWIKDKTRLVEGKRMQKDYDLANKELDYIQSICPKVTYLEGNHENWVNQYIDRNPTLEGMLELPTNLSFKERCISFIKMNDLYKTGNLYWTHGMYTGKYHANQHLTRLGCNVVYGHLHQTQSAMMNMRMIEPYKAWSIGCLCGHSPEYMKNRPSNWLNGFCVVYLNTKTGNFNLYTVDIINNRFMFNGKEYKL